MSVGTFNVARKIWTNEVFRREAYSEREAFIWMVSQAAWRAHATRTGDYIAQLDRGQFCHSVRFMATAWMWTPARVFRFLGRLSDHGMIEKRNSSETAPSVITICNYEKYQAQRNSDVSETEQQRNSSETEEKKGNKGNKENNPPSPRKRVVEPDGFQAFWDAYPRREDKADAVKAFNAALKKATAAEIADGARRYAKAVAGKDQKFTKLPAGWLRNERWTDAPASSAGKDWWQDAYGIPDLDKGGGDDPSRNFSQNRRAPALAERCGPDPVLGMLAAAQEKARPVFEFEDGR